MTGLCVVGSLGLCPTAALWRLNSSPAGPRLFTSLMSVGLASCIEGCSWASVAGNTVILEPKRRGAVRTYTGKVFPTQAAGGPAAFKYVRGIAMLEHFGFGTRSKGST